VNRPTSAPMSGRAFTRDMPPRPAE
jgi:hypothetical protein